ncbi:MAG TPA: hypothetical protein VLC91_14350 [Spongiibacteraceae bacterium]|nr:hypothetical protein [Spongiibacteraceae bacterium]
MTNIFQRKINLFTQCITLSAASIFSLNAYSDITPESMAGVAPGCSSSGTDTACWQGAINAATTPITAGDGPRFATVAGEAGKVYTITDTIKICGASNGVIDGHGAQLLWQGGSGKPMFLVVGSNSMRFTNFTIRAYATSPKALDTAFEFTSAPTSGFSYTTALPAGDCPNGLPTTSSKNSIDQVSVDGTTAGGLNYGVRFSNRYGVNGDEGINNDMSTIIDSSFYNVTSAVVKIEHGQSHQHRLISVNGFATEGNTNGCFVEGLRGFFSSTGGFQWGWGKANFCVDRTYGTFDINESNSEGSKRLLAAGDEGDNNSYPVSVNIHGGRFAVNGLHSDGKVIDFNRLGPLVVVGLHIDGTPPSGVQPKISMQPGQRIAPPVTTVASAIVNGVSFDTAGSVSSSTWDTLVVKSFVDLVAKGNLCSNAAGNTQPCTILRN